MLLVFLLAGNAILIILLFSNSISALSNQLKEIPSYSSENKIIIAENFPPLSPSPSPTPTPTPTSIPSPTLMPSPSLTPILTPETEPVRENSNEINKTNIPVDTSGDVGLNLMKQINDFRASKSLPPLSTDGYTCAFAVLRAEEIKGNFSHDGFRSRIDASSLPYPSYSSIAENIAMNSDPNGVVPGWINSPGHNENMSNNVNFGCVAKNGDYYVFQAWQP